ncbi:hypothetical protein CN504_13650 [Bacillus anthracis]|nr:hypothetical protein CN504_13650 [Bacillus anthracis]
MGLKPREKDIRQLKGLLPELFEKEAILKIEGPVIHPLYPYFRIRLDSLMEWIKQEPLIVESSEEGSFSNCNCLLADCLNNRNADKLSMLTVGGFVSNTPKKGFFDLVTKTHKGQKVKEVIITDRFIYLDSGEDGTPGGYKNIITYLQTLRIGKTDEFSIITNPHAKSQGKKIAFEEYIRSEFPNVKFRVYQGNNSFHDRFYLVRDRQGQMKGIFGPSLNGLNSESIVIMGDIDDSKVLKTLNDRLS